VTASEAFASKVRKRMTALDGKEKGDDAYRFGKMGREWAAGLVS
jgi:hypothetical protein